MSRYDSSYGSRLLAEIPDVGCFDWCGGYGPFTFVFLKLPRATFFV